jgi:hypothetical protein
MRERPRKHLVEDCGAAIFVIKEPDVSGGIFDIAPGEPGVYQVFVDEDWTSKAFLNAFSNWCSDAREQGRVSKAC